MQLKRRLLIGEIPYLLRQDRQSAFLYQPLLLKKLSFPHVFEVTSGTNLTSPLVDD